jgi:NitT/TauT family transport system substrate-binding protein
MTEKATDLIAGVAEQSMDRRRFFRSTAAAGAAVAIPSWLLTACGNTATGAAGTTSGSASVLKATHGTGLCNLGLFLVKERNLAKADGVSLDFVVTPTNADIATLFGAGQVDIAVMPYTHFMSVWGQGAPVKIVAGAGVQGCVLLAQPGITSAAGLRGKTVGTFQADTLEMVAYDYFKKAGLSSGDVKMRYFGTSPELAQAFISGSIDGVALIEPYATQALKGRPGAVKLTDGTDLYGANYTDCVLAVHNELITKDAKALKAVIKGMMTAQRQTEQDRHSAVQATVGKYFKASLADVLDASTKQPNVVDQQHKASFMLDRAKDMIALGYLKKQPDQSIFDWSLLQQVIDENKALYNSLQRKSA